MQDTTRPEAAEALTGPHGWAASGKVTLQTEDAQRGRDRRQVGRLEGGCHPWETRREPTLLQGARTEGHGVCTDLEETLAHSGDSGKGHANL